MKKTDAGSVPSQECSTAPSRCKPSAHGPLPTADGFQAGHFPKERGP
jgi:hypothetical protein